MNEFVVEQSALEYLAALGYQTRPGMEFAPDHPYAERAGWGDVVLVRRLRAKLGAISPKLPTSAIEDAVRRVLLHDSPLAIANNRVFHQLLIEGVDVEHPGGWGDCR